MKDLRITWFSGGNWSVHKSSPTEYERGTIKS